MKKTYSKKSPLPQSKKIPETGSISNWIEKYSIYLFLGLLFFITLYVFKDYIFFKKLYLFKDIGSDTINAFYPSYLNNADYLQRFGIPKWSFNFGVGQNINAFWLRDPLQLILYAIGSKSLAFGIIYIQLINIFGSGVLFYYYLKTIGINGFSSLLGALIFSLSGFMILGSGWYIFTSDAFSLVLLLLAFEQLYKKNSWILFPLGIAYVGIALPFNYVPLGIFLLTYIIFRYVSDNGLALKGLFPLFFKLFLLSLLGLGLSAAFLFSNILQMIESPRGSGGASYAQELMSRPMFSFEDKRHNLTAILRFFSNDILGAGSGYGGWSNYLEAPIGYCGIITLLLIPQVFTFLNKRKKIIFALFLALWLLPAIFPYFRYAFWMFTGDYYRIFSLFLAFVFIYFSINAISLSEKLKIKPMLLLISSLILICILYYSYSQIGKNFIYKPVKPVVISLLILYTCLLLLWNIESIRQYIKILIIFTLGFELAFFSYQTANKRSVITATEFASKVGYNDYSVEAIDYLKKTDQTFYRIDKDYSSGSSIHESINDGMVQGYKGTSVYNSFNQINYIKFLEGTNVIKENSENQSRWALGLRGRLLLQSICNVKYFLSKSRDIKSLVMNGFDSIAVFGDVKLLRNKYFLPLGYTYDKCVDEKLFKKLSPMQKDFTLLKYCVIDSGSAGNFKGMAEFSIKDTSKNYSWEELRKDIHNLRRDTLTITNFEDSHIKGKINLAESKILFLAIPFDKGWSLKLNGKETELKKLNIGFMGVFLEKGEYNMELIFQPRYYEAGIILSCLSLLLYISLLLWRRFKKISVN